MCSALELHTLSHLHGTDMVSICTFFIFCLSCVTAYYVRDSSDLQEWGTPGLSHWTCLHNLNNYIWFTSHRPKKMIFDSPKHGSKKIPWLKAHVWTIFPTPTIPQDKGAAKPGSSTRGGHGVWSISQAVFLLRILGFLFHFRDQRYSRLSIAKIWRFFFLLFVHTILSHHSGFIWVVGGTASQQTKIETCGDCWPQLGKFSQPLKPSFIPTPVGWGQRQGNSCPDGFLEAGATSRDLRAGATAGSRMTFHVF